MKKNHIKDRLADGGDVVACFVRLPEPGIVEILGYAGINCVILDVEHSSIGWVEAERMILAAFAVDITPLIRVPRLEQDVITRALDIGAQGIIAPHVCDAEQACLLRKYSCYPPKGSRGLATGRASQWGLSSAKEYFANAQEEILIGGMIEDQIALDHLPAIKDACLDLWLFGPADMSGSVGVPGEVNHPIIQDFKQRVLNEAKGTNTTVGIAVQNEQAAAEALEAGFRFLAIGPAEVLLARRVRQFIQTIGHLRS